MTKDKKQIGRDAQRLTAERIVQDLKSFGLKFEHIGQHSTCSEEEYFPIQLLFEKDMITVICKGCGKIIAKRNGKKLNE